MNMKEMNMKEMKEMKMKMKDLLSWARRKALRLLQRGYTFLAFWRKRAPALSAHTPEYEIRPLREEDASQVISMEREAYPPHLRAGDDLDEVLWERSRGVFLPDGRMVAYLLIEQDEEVEEDYGLDAYYVNDVVASKESPVFGFVLLLSWLEELPSGMVVTGYCLEGSQRWLDHVERRGFKFLHREEDSLEGEPMVSVAVLKR